MFAELANVRKGLRKSQVRVTGVDGRCHVEDASGAKLQDIDVLRVPGGSEPDAPPAVPEVHTALQGQRLVAPASHAHGSRGNESWAMPRMTKFCEASARPGYHSLKAHEYHDEEDVLKAKVRILADLLREARSAIAYTGAGISVSAGIPDWATKHADASATCLSGEELAKVAASAQPTLAHRVLTAAHFQGLLPKWIQQNHDGLPQKAGYPQAAMNEIHGAIFDPSNPLVPMDGQVRDDLHADLLRCQRHSDLVLALGSSLCGMAADQLVGIVADRARRHLALGVVIVALQQTVRDEESALRIFAPLDEVAKLLAEELHLAVSQEESVYIPSVPAEHRRGEDVFSVMYGRDGQRLTQQESRTELNLSLGSEVRIAAGPDAGKVAVVEGKNEEGHYLLRLGHSNGGSLLLLGSWWLEAAVSGTTDSIPISSV